jgi:L-rhamnose mutarotase
VISVQSGDQVVVKKVTELRGFQMLRLYEIYAEEQMNLQVLIAEDEKEKAAIMAQRESRQHRWKLVLDNMDKDNAVGENKVEKEAKLDDLMSQL